MGSLADNFVRQANQLQRSQVALADVGAGEGAGATEVDKARHVPSGRYHTNGAHIEQAHGYGIARTGEGKFLVTEPDASGDLHVHSTHDNIDDARTAALRRRITS